VNNKNLPANFKMHLQLTVGKERFALALLHYLGSDRKLGTCHFFGKR